MTKRKENKIEQELQLIHEGLFELSNSLKDFISSYKTESATLTVGDKQVQLSSSKLTSTELLTVCTHAIDLLGKK